MIRHIKTAVTTLVHLNKNYNKNHHSHSDSKNSPDSSSNLARRNNFFSHQKSSSPLSGSSKKYTNSFEDPIESISKRHKSISCGPIPSFENITTANPEKDNSLYHQESD